MQEKFMKLYEDITFTSSEDLDIKRENANIDGNTAMGTMLKYGSEGAKLFNMEKVLSPKYSEAHSNGDIHIHDLDFLTLTATCCQIDLEKLFTGGFNTGHGYIREPQSIQTYAALACIAIQSNQNEMHGGQSIPAFDYYMAPGVNKSFRKNLINIYSIFNEIDEEYKQTMKNQINDITLDTPKEEIIEWLSFYTNEKESEIIYSKALLQTERDTYQAMESVIHNLNTMHSRAGAQIPFSSLNYGTDTSIAGRLVIKSLLLATQAGLGNGETPIFPIQIFKVKAGISYNPCDPNYDLFKLALATSAKRLFPNFSFLDAPFNAQFYKEGQPETEATYMGCRTRVISNINDKNKEIVTGRGNLSFTTINLPRLGIEHPNFLDFYEALDKTISLVFDQLLERFDLIKNKTRKNFPFLIGQGLWIDGETLEEDETIEEVLKHGTLTLGFIGLAECLKALLGEHHGESVRAWESGYEIIKFMRKKCDEKALETGLNFSLIATPAEGLSGRFTKIDRKKHGIIKGVTDREYYTNSFHIPVYYDITAFQKIELEAPFHELTNAGHISYVEMDGDPSKNLDAFEAIIRKMYDSGMGYGSINHPLDRDTICGYVGVIKEVCPKCGATEEEHKIDRIRRITGYLVGTLDRFNDGKAAEEKERVKHK